MITRKNYFDVVLSAIAIAVAALTIFCAPHGEDPPDSGSEPPGSYSADCPDTAIVFSDNVIRRSELNDNAAGLDNTLFSNAVHSGEEWQFSLEPPPTGSYSYSIEAADLSGLGYQDSTQNVTLTGMGIYTLRFDNFAWPYLNCQLAETIVVMPESCNELELNLGYGETYSSGDLIPISIEGPDEYIKSIDWIINGQKQRLSKDTLSFTVDGLADGNYTINAVTRPDKKIDDALMPFDLTPCVFKATLTVATPGVCDQFNISTPADGATFTEGETIQFEVSTGSPPPLITVNWGTPTEVPGELDIFGYGNPLPYNSLPQGTHTVVAKVDSDITCYKQITITISPPSPVAVRIPDTGQLDHYAIGFNTIDPPPAEGDPFYGQDADYDKLNLYAIGILGGIPTVIDGVSNLVWEMGGTSSIVTWTGAKDYCAGLGEGWRLPNQSELMTIVNYGASDPDPAGFDVFSTMADYGYYWSATESGANPAQAWAVSFQNGHSTTMSKTSPYADMYARCVNDAGTSFPEPHTFEVLDGKPDIIRDVTTGYQWHKSDNGSNSFDFTWEAALAYCENSELGDFYDWKLPDVKELDTIVNRSKATGLLLDTFFDATPVGQYDSQSYWTSTTAVKIVAGTFGGVWQVDFKTGRVDSSYKAYGTPAFARCVRIP